MIDFHRLIIVSSGFLWQEQHRLALRQLYSLGRMGKSSISTKNCGRQKGIASYFGKACRLEYVITITIVIHLIDKATPNRT